MAALPSSSRGEALAAATTSSSDTARLLFCNRCDMLLYPSSDDARQLRWVCRACNNEEDHDDAKLVYQLDLRKEVTASKADQLLAQFAKDPTVPLTTDKVCPNCHQKRVAWFINPLEQPVEDMSLTFACVVCSHVWQDRDATATAT